MSRIAIAADHAAIDLKALLADWLREQGHEVTDLGPHSEESVDYPDYGYRLADTIAEGGAEFGVDRGQRDSDHGYVDRDEELQHRHRAQHEPCAHGGGTGPA